MDTTQAVLKELELAAIPHVLVFNKIDALGPIERKILQKKHPDAILVSAIDRESTRPLLSRLAGELAERWEQSAKMPAAPVVEEEPSAAEGEAPNGGEVHATTLEELLRASGRRKRAQRPAY